jgi:hypothetical protein
LACEPVDLLDPMDGVDPGGAEDPPDAPPPEPQEAVCAPEFIWRRPGGGGLMGGHDSDWRIVPREPDGWDAGGTREWINLADECGRVVDSTVWSDCADFDGCSSRASTTATYDAAGRLVTEGTSVSAFVSGNAGAIRISHRYDERGARISTWATDSHDRPQVAAIEARQFQNDPAGRVVVEEVRRFQDDWDQVGVAVRRSTFQYDDATGEVTESVDEGADGSVDRVVVFR